MSSNLANVNDQYKNNVFLTMEDMMEKLQVSRKTFWSMRKNNEVPEAVIKNPMRWRQKDIDAFYDEKNSK